jgi:gluconokinase
MEILGLRSPYDKVDGIVYFGRMIDKIRLHSAGHLPAEYLASLGEPWAFDGRCSRFLGIQYPELSARVKAGASESELLEWAYNDGRKPSEEEGEIWNAFMQKRGWRDEASARLLERKQEWGIVSDRVLTSFDFIDADEGRPLRFERDPAPVQNGVRPTVSIPGLRSPYERVSGIFHFARMLDKIRLAAQGKLPAEWLEASGAPNGFDGICCQFLRVDYPVLKERVGAGGRDDELLQWTFSNGRKPSDEEVEIWNAYMAKRSWRDQYMPRLHLRLQQAAMPIGAALTMFDFIDLDEGRLPHWQR